MSNRSPLMQLALLALLFCSTAIVQAESEIDDDDVADLLSTARDGSMEEDTFLPSSTAKRGTTFRWGKRQSGVFRWGKRPSGVFRWGKRPSGVFRWGKRPSGVFRWGKRQSGVFRWGKRSPILDGEVEND
ncbi:hypothetical protein BOX15_Mlig026077g1 [Macrostomum lignano]|uniref:Uncharacterized protein n=1 Tax=Macrostomum lignano TaxID=282301 RepID=A0A267ENZ8_9PLAT|nr:hypothetical protein BOX15_Mlig026077g2 [Macrostomum lignano]PAA62704.1 hypothetical protein BOX15_Mlig026077g1 [Macrostomum lignano]